jgi:hypothetical protein
MPIERVPDAGESPGQGPLLFPVDRLSRTRTVSGETPVKRVHLAQRPVQRRLEPRRIQRTA